MSDDNLVISLQIQEAKKRDIGRNIARIDKEIMKKLKISWCDNIILIGKKEIKVEIWPGYPQDSVI